MRSANQIGKVYSDMDEVFRIERVHPASTVKKPAARIGAAICTIYQRLLLPVFNGNDSPGNISSPCTLALKTAHFLYMFVELRSSNLSWLRPPTRTCLVYLQRKLLSTLLFMGCSHSCTSGKTRLKTANRLESPFLAMILFAPARVVTTRANATAIVFGS
jgi:hypothetical protein